MEHFNRWNEVKKTLQIKNNKLTLKEREIYWLHLGENVGYEQNGKGDMFLRPVLIYKIFNQHVFYGIPLTSKVKNESLFYMRFYVKEKENYAILSQMRLFDIKRVHDRLGKISSEEFEKLKNKLRDLLDLTPTLASGLPV